jgi:hypothetical protein
MAITVEEIHQLYKERVVAQGPVLAQMRKVRDHANGDIVVPLNELDRNAVSSVASLLTQGLDQMSTRVASTMPMPYFPPLKDGQERSMNIARDRKKAMLSIWDMNRMNMKMRRRSRHLLAYSSSPVIIKPDFKTLTPKWHVRNPLDTFPSFRDDPDDPVPDNVIFTYTKPAKWLMDNYAGQVIGKLRMGKLSYDQTFTILEYVCADEIVMAVIGTEKKDWQSGAEYQGNEIVELERIYNRTGMPLAVVPQRITLDRPRGQFDGMLNTYFTRARLQALTEIAIERGIFPDEYLVARPGENPEIMQVADGKLGQLGVVKGGDIQQYQINPGYKTDIALDRLERQERLEGAIPAEFGGESGSNIRTGRRGESILSATIDFRVQEAQSIFESSLKEEDKIAIAIERTYWGKEPKSFFLSGFTGGKKDYTPEKLWETDHHFVSYPASGSDVNSLIVGLGQRLGTGLMSKESAREADPLIADPELERDRIVAEGIEAALLSSIQAQAADPNGPYQPDDLAFIAEMVGTNKMGLPAAIQAAQKRAQERQATPAPMGAPETMPGLAPPGMGAEQPMEPPTPGGGGIEGLLSQLGGGGMPPGMGGPPAGAAAPPGTPGSVLSLAGRLGGA